MFGAAAMLSCLKKNRPFGGRIYAVWRTFGRTYIGYNIGANLCVHDRSDPDGCGRYLNKYSVSIVSREKTLCRSALHGGMEPAKRSDRGERTLEQWLRSELLSVSQLRVSGASAAQNMPKMWLGACLPQLHARAHPYNPTQNAWHAISGLPHGRSDFCAVPRLPGADPQKCEALSLLRLAGRLPHYRAPYLAAFSATAHPSQTQNLRRDDSLPAL